MALDVLSALQDITKLMDIVRVKFFSFTLISNFPKVDSGCSIAHCSSCSDPTTCTQCEEGYTLNNQNECHLNSNNPSQPNQACKTML